MWDFWLVDDGSDYHLFFLYASRALRDPHARHYRASIGHAVSADLRTWQRVTDALVPAVRIEQRSGGLEVEGVELPAVVDEPCVPGPDVRKEEHT